MEPVSTFNFGRSIAAQGLAQGQAIQLKDLATKARQLKGIHNSTAGYKLNPVPSQGGQMEANAPRNEKNQELMEVAKQFEAILIHQMLKAMRQTVHKSDLLNSFSLEQYESMLDEEIANEMAAHRGIGLAETLYYQLSRLEESVNPTSGTVSANTNQEVNINE